MSSRAFRATPDNNYLVPRRSRDQQETSPDRNRIWTEPGHRPIVNRKVPVVYYLCRNGQLDHPHFMEVTLSSSDGLYLKDVINRLNELRGKGMASLYSWSSKRSYKNGFVWHDLSEEDFIFPVQGQEYVLKGSEVLDSCLLSNPRSLLGTTSFRDPRSLNPDKNSGDDIPPAIHRRRNQSWSSIDLSEYRVYKATTESTTAESTRRLGADAATQTEDRRRRRKPAKEEVGSLASYEKDRSTELSRDEISPPPSDSSPETLESLIKADGRLVSRQSESANDHRTVESLSSGRMRASAVLMQLISCGTMSFKECGPVLLKDHGMSLTGRSGCTVARGAGDNNGLERAEKELESFGRVKLEDKEYFSGSLIESKKELVPALQRSSSYNDDRSSRMGPTTEKDEEEAVRAKCIPRKPKSMALRNNGVHQ
ncbi:UPSTREAM OF FLC protein [Hirschfeldia incana]|nr:UPSTREAM OF FLC protein [Hirschfeldia incana]